MTILQSFYTENYSSERVIFNTEALKLKETAHGHVSDLIYPLTIMAALHLVLKLLKLFIKTLSNGQICQTRNHRRLKGSNGSVTIKHTTEKAGVQNKYFLWWHASLVST